jgi:hypothetical protein
MYAQLQITGKVLKVLEKEYQEKVSYSLQFMTQDEKQGFKIIPVKVEKDFLPTNIKDNDNVEINIKISTMNNILYFSAVDKVKLIINK